MNRSAAVLSLTSSTVSVPPPPAVSVNLAIAQGLIADDLPYIRSVGVALLNDE